MQLAEQLLGSAIPMLTNLVILLYICQRVSVINQQNLRVKKKKKKEKTLIKNLQFLAATMLRRRIIAEMREFSTIVTYTRW